MNKKIIKISLSPLEHKQLEIVCKKRKISLHEFISKALEEKVTREVMHSGHDYHNN